MKAAVLKLPLAACRWLPVSAFRQDVERPCAVRSDLDPPMIHGGGMCLYFVEERTVESSRNPRGSVRRPTPFGHTAGMW